MLGVKRAYFSKHRGHFCHFFIGGQNHNLLKDRGQICTLAFFFFGGESKQCLKLFQRSINVLPLIYHNHHHHQKTTTHYILVITQTQHLLTRSNSLTLQSKQNQIANGEPNITGEQNPESMHRFRWPRWSRHFFTYSLGLSPFYRRRWWPELWKILRTRERRWQRYLTSRIR